MTKQRSGKKGFTLIELLVVIAIIAILAAILFPVFARARENARKATCQSGMKQLASGFMMYYQDYDEGYPWYRFGPGSPGKYNANYYWWPEMLYPYTKNIQVGHCPSSPRQRTAGTTTADFWYGFGYNYHLGKNASSHGATYEQPAAQERAAETLLLADSTVYIVWCPVANPNYWYDGGTGGTSATLPADRPMARYQGVGDWHMDGANVAFCDGHVKWFKIDRTVDRTQEKRWWGH
ncbi:MAG: DUF1559 domain-containing protein [Armatimonadota bacterium]|nr:DUF1559 domain-containing protein [Armatimonadota bacterium]